MISLALDIGNTLIKVGLFEDNTLKKIYHQLTPDTLNDVLNTLEYQAAIVSSVKSVPHELTQAFAEKASIIYLNAATRLPFSINYETPHTLGADRIASVAGASWLHPNANVLAIDMGTCITYDLIDRQQQFCGGGIAPGLQMRLQAMHTFTARLPLITRNEIAVDDLPLVGKNTHDCMVSGAVHGMGAEITEMIRMYADKFADLQVVICGGDASRLTKIIKQKHSVIPELILIGLNRILLYNVF